MITPCNIHARTLGRTGTASALRLPSLALLPLLYRAPLGEIRGKLGKQQLPSFSHGHQATEPLM